MWKDIKGFEGYYQENGCEVRSVDRYVIKAEGAQHLQKGKILKPRYQNGVTLVYNLWKNNVNTSYEVIRPITVIGKIKEGIIMMVEFSLNGRCAKTVITSPDTYMKAAKNYLKSFKYSKKDILQMKVLSYHGKSYI